MIIKKIGIIEQYTISPNVKKLTRKEKRDLADKMFKEKYQGKTITYKKLEESLFIKINKYTRNNFSAHKNREKNQSHTAKLELAADGHYLNALKNAEYGYELKEKKKNQSQNHKSSNKYYYFYKVVMIDDIFYRLIINVQETNNKNCFIHFVKIENI